MMKGWGSTGTHTDGSVPTTTTATADKDEGYVLCVGHRAQSLTLYVHTISLDTLYIWWARCMNVTCARLCKRLGTFILFRVSVRVPFASLLFRGETCVGHMKREGRTGILSLRR